MHLTCLQWLFLLLLTRHLSSLLLFVLTGHFTLSPRSSIVNLSTGASCNTSPGSGNTSSFSPVTWVTRSEVIHLVRGESILIVLFRASHYSTLLSYLRSAIFLLRILLAGVRSVTESPTKIFLKCLQCRSAMYSEGFRLRRLLPEMRSYCYSRLDTPVLVISQVKQRRVRSVLRGESIVEQDWQYIISLLSYLRSTIFLHRTRQTDLCKVKRDCTVNNPSPSIRKAGVRSTAESHLKYFLNAFWRVRRLEGKL